MPGTRSPTYRVPEWCAAQRPGPWNASRSTTDRRQRLVRLRCELILDDIRHDGHRGKDVDTNMPTHSIILEMPYRDRAPGIGKKSSVRSPGVTAGGVDASGSFTV